MDLKTIALDSVPAVAELKEFNRGTNDGMCEESAATDTGKEYWTGTDATADSLAAGAGRNEASGEPVIVRIQNGVMMETG